MSDDNTPLLELVKASKRFAKPVDLLTQIGIALRPGAAAGRDRFVHAVEDVSLAIQRGEALGLVGESGSGKSTLARIAVGLHRPSSGIRLWKGVALDALPAAERRRAQLPIQMIFQDPYGSLNPRMRVLDIVGEAPVVHGMVAASEKKAAVEALLDRVGLAPAMATRFPHQFSGGQRARVGIARALALQPELLVCDEAVAALDVSIQAQVLNLFMHLRDTLNLTYLFISHDLNVVRLLSDRVAVMYLGRLVEIAAVDELFARPSHPYTQMLLASAPTMEVKMAHPAPARGETPSAAAAPGGCPFHPRCPHAMARCKNETPMLKEIAVRHFSACHLDD
ncbi:MAG: oppF [Herminiimonas sp.]|nr:oppF [Herminiimonas sp.]